MKLWMPFLLLLAAGCAVNPAGNAEQITFGTYHGFCRSNCAPMYRLANGELRKDTTDYVIRGGQPSFNILLSAAQKASAEDLRKLIPASVLGKDSTYGCPDCADQGGVYLQVVAAGQTTTIKMDTQEGAIPESLRPLAARIKVLSNEF